MNPTAAYPDAWTTDVVVADGGVVRLRPLRPDDGPNLLDLASRLSDEALYYRFMSPFRPETDADVAPFLDLDYRERFALGAELGGKLVAVGRYMSEADRASAEVAFVVEDRHQQRGIGSLLLEHLAAIARSNGITRFHASTLGDNEKMLRVFADAGYQVHRTLEQGVWEVNFGLDDSSVEAVTVRERTAEAASVARVLAPRSVAVIGASRRPGSIGNTVFRNIIDGDFAGVVYPVNHTADSVAGVKAYASIDAIPDPVDLAVIVVPADLVAGVLDAAGDAGVGAAVIITAGFAEIGPEGARAQTELVQIAHRHGLRLVGPNCVGVINTAEDVRLNATFAPTEPERGTIGFASQSGALGLAILEVAGDLGLGLSSFVSLGNKADISGNDLLQYWEQDAATEVALLYLESFGNPRKFSRLARRFCRTKPLVVVKSGRSEAGRRAASSHTAALASSDVLADTLFRQAGITRVTTLEQLFDVARLVAHQPLPRGRRVAIVGNSGGPGILAADACAGAGLVVAELAQSTQDRLRGLLPPGAAVSNPVDLVASGTGANYESALQAVLDDDGIDAILVIFTDTSVTDPADVVTAIQRVAQVGAAKPIAATFLSGDVGRSIATRDADGRRRDVPVFPFPEAPAIALGHIAALAEWRQRPLGVIPKLEGVDQAAARVLASRTAARTTEGAWMGTDELAELLGCFGIPFVESIVVSSPDEARAVASRLGRPVALKVVSDTIQHKSDVGGVVLDVDVEDVERHYAEMAERLGTAMTGVLVQPMVGPGVEVIVGAVDDPSFGPVVMFGLGGTAVELFADRAFSIVPLTDLDAAELVRAPRSSALLRGHRGSQPVDLAALEDLVLRVSRLADNVPELAELDLNPVIARPDGVFVVDARARLEPDHDPLVQPIRRLDRPGRPAP
ncbi:MAG: GNAT family N-acetyltransferase [Acidimicrobiia bacterium]